MQLDLRQAAAKQAVCVMAAEQASEQVDFPQCAARLATHALTERRCLMPETETLENLENPTAELDAHTHTMAHNEVEPATPLKHPTADQIQNLTTTGTLEPLLRRLHDAQRCGVLSSSNYANSKAAAIARWLRDAYQPVDRKKVPMDDVEDRTTELGEHPHTVDLNEGQIPVFVPKPVADLPVKKGLMSAFPAPDPFQPGRTIRGRYVIEELIGQGGFANVYRALDLRRDAMDGINLHVAVKVLRSELRERPGTTPRLKREFRQTQQLLHPNVVRVFDLDAHDRVWFMVMELLEGETLAARLRRQAGVPVPFAEAHALLAACADALSFAHDRQIVHGDLKPTNLFVLHDGSVRILDFGSSPEMNANISDGKADPTNQVATPAYASPQVRARESVDPRDDLFSFACVAFEILAGHHPFALRSSEEFQVSNGSVIESAAISPEQMATLKQGLAWRREDRPDSVREFFQCLMSLNAADPEQKQDTEEVSTDIALITRPLLPAPDVIPAPILIADPDNIRPPPAVSADPASVVAEAELKPAVRTDQRRSLEALSPLITPKVFRISSPGRIRLYACAAMFVLAYLGFLSFNSPQAELQATVATRSIAPQTQVTLGPPPSTPTPQQGVTHQLANAATETRSTSQMKPSARIATNKFAPAVSFSTDTMTVTPSAGLAAIILKRINGHTGRLRVQWRLKAGTAAIGEDFSGPMSGFAEFADNQQVRILFVPLLNNPNRNGDRTFIVELTNASTRALIAPVDTIKVTILDVS